MRLALINSNEELCIIAAKESEKSFQIYRLLFSGFLPNASLVVVMSNLLHLIVIIIIISGLRYRQLYNYETSMAGNKICELYANYQ